MNIGNMALRDVQRSSEILVTPSWQPTWLICLFTTKEQTPDTHIFSASVILLSRPVGNFPLNGGGVSTAFQFFP